METKTRKRLDNEIEITIVISYNQVIIKCKWFEELIFKIMKNWEIWGGGRDNNIDNKRINQFLNKYFTWWFLHWLKISNSFF